MHTFFIVIFLALVGSCTADVEANPIQERAATIVTKPTAALTTRRPTAKPVTPPTKKTSTPTFKPTTEANTVNVVAIGKHFTYIYNSVY